MYVALNEQNVKFHIKDRVEQIDSYPGGYQDRGIVICAGGIRFQTCGWVLIKMLRKLGCTLPIEVFYLGKEERNRDWEALVEPLNVKCINAHDFLPKHPHRSLRGWESKAYSILHSSFKEVLFLDADVIPVRDPSFLFEEAGYLEHGAIFWPDPEKFRTHEDSPRWNIFDVPYREEFDFESGQLVINKEKCWQAINLCNWFNEYSDFFYQYVYGDKDTFRFAWHRTETPFAMTHLGASEKIPRTLLQHDFEGKPLFQHRFAAKWSLQQNYHCPGFEWEEECLQYVEELKELWNPVSESMGEPDALELSLMDEYEGKVYRCYRDGRRQGRLHLQPNHTLQQLPTQQQSFWWFKGNQLILALDEARTMTKLSEQEDGIWETSCQESKHSETKLKLVPS